MKGFLRMVEVIIMSLVTVLIIIQFTYIPRIKSDWESTELLVQSRDLLFSLDKKGVDWLNASEIENEISDAMKANVLYSMEINNILKPDPMIGCICSGAEFAEMQGLLTDFSVNGLLVNFTLQRIDPSSISFPSSLDGIVVYDYDLGPHYWGLYNFLSKGKGIVEFRDMQQSDIDSVQQYIFGISWNTSIFPTGANINFTSNETENRYYNIYKYFHALPRFQDDFSSGLGKWTTQTGTPQISSSGNPSPSVRLQGTQCGGSTNTWIYATDTSGYSDMVIDADVYMENGGRIALTFRLDPSQGESYMARFSTSGRDRFLEQRDPTTWSPIGRNFGHTSLPNEWIHMRVVVRGDSFELYNNGVLVANASDSSYTDGYIGFFHECANAYVDNVKVTFPELYEFDNFISGERVWPSDSEIEKIILRQKNSGVPACIVNSNMASGTGRAAWLSRGLLDSDIEIMLKNLVLWSVGYSYEAIKNDVKLNPVKTSMFKVFNKDTFQPAEIVLTMGYLY